MDHKSYFSKKYAELCQTLGDLYFRSELVAHNIREIKKQIEELNAAAAEADNIAKINSKVTPLKSPDENK